MVPVAQTAPLSPTSRTTTATWSSPPSATSPRSRSRS